MRAHDLTGMDPGDVYDQTQCDDEIASGDILITDEGIAMLLGAWPTMIFGTSGALHSLMDDTTWDDVLANEHPWRPMPTQESLLVAWAIACG